MRRTLRAISIGMVVLGLMLMALQPAAGEPRAKRLKLSSADFPKGGSIPALFACLQYGGQDISPQLSWSKGPEGTKSYALVLHDPDAPGGTFYHWGIYNIPAKTRSLQQAFEAASPVKETLNDFGQSGYNGPCPPAGASHGYVFTVYALKSKKVTLPEGAGVTSLLSAIAKKKLLSGALTGTFAGGQ
jgi:Raf kinase inhibitor-like YbhB/YbcL family protein